MMSDRPLACRVVCVARVLSKCSCLKLPMCAAAMAFVCSYGMAYEGTAGRVAASMTDSPKVCQVQHECAQPNLIPHNHVFEAGGGGGGH
jgi:hypothetical protein